MKKIIICILFILLSCSTNIQHDKSTKFDPDLKQPKQESLKIEDLDKIIVLLNENPITTRIFYEEFTQSPLIKDFAKKINFYYSLEEIQPNSISDTIIIGPTNSDLLIPLKEKLGSNNLILSLTNDLTFKKEFSKDQIIFLGMSPFSHIDKLKDTVDKSTSFGLLYKQNYYGVRLANYFKKEYSEKYIKSSPYTDTPEDISLAIQDLGYLLQYDNIILIDDSLAYKDVLTNLNSQNSIYDYDKIYLIDNFLEQRNTISSFYKKTKRTYLSNYNLEKTTIPHRELFYRASINMALAIVSEIIETKKFTKLVFSKELGYLEVVNSAINYLVVFQ